MLDSVGQTETAVVLELEEVVEVSVEDKSAALAACKPARPLFIIFSFHKARQAANKLAEAGGEPMTEPCCL